MMPDMDGYETCIKIKREVQVTREIPIIFVTAKTDPEDVIDGFRAAAVDYISKQ